MLRIEDIVLLFVVFSSIAGGVLFPGFGSWFREFPVYGMMGLLLLSFLSVPLDSIRQLIRKSPGSVAYLLVAKMIVLPLTVYFIFEWLFPSHALAALLLAGISPAVMSPLISEMLAANTAFVIVGMASSCFLVPVTLPALVKLLAGRTMVISFTAMVRTLSLVVFIPFIAAELLKRFSPRVADRLLALRYPASLLIISLQMLGIFSAYAEVFRRQASIIGVALVASFAVAAVSFLAALLFSWRMPVREQLSYLIAIAMPNNVLSMVFAAQFFGAVEPLVSAIYMVPFWLLLIPMRMYQKLRLTPAEASGKEPLPKVEPAGREG